MNNVMLVGRIKEIQEKKNGIKILLSVLRATKNENGEYEADIIPVLINQPVVLPTKEYIAEGLVVGLRGRLEVHRETGFIVITEKITLLSTGPERLAAEKE